MYYYNYIIKLPSVGKEIRKKILDIFGRIIEKGGFKRNNESFVILDFFSSLVDIENNKDIKKEDYEKEISNFKEILNKNEFNNLIKSVQNLDKDLKALNNEIMEQERIINDLNDLVEEKKDLQNRYIECLKEERDRLQLKAKKKADDAKIKIEDSNRNNIYLNKLRNYINSDVGKEKKTYYSNLKEFSDYDRIVLFKTTCKDDYVNWYKKCNDNILKHIGVEAKNYYILRKPLRSYSKVYQITFQITHMKIKYGIVDFSRNEILYNHNNVFNSGVWISSTHLFYSGVETKLKKEMTGRLVLELDTKDLGKKSATLGKSSNNKVSALYFYNDGKLLDYCFYGLPEIVCFAVCLCFYFVISFFLFFILM